MKQFIFILIIFVTIPSTRAQQTYVPDDNFEQALIDLGYDDVLDDYVLTENISGVTELYVGEKEISDLTGIEGFTALTYLNCYSNQLTSLDVSSNTALTNMDCGSNQLTNLDVSSNTSLTTLDCDNNSLTSLDVGSALTSLYCRHNSLASLDVSASTALTDLRCSNNQLTSLDVSSNTALTGLLCSNNQLTYLNMKNGVTDAYTHFSAQTNDLTCIETLDPVYATANWTYANGNIDDGVTFSESCTALISVSPSELYEQLIEGNSSTQVLTIANEGGSDLEWEIASDLIDLTGTWDLNYDWDCTGSPGSTTVTFSSDGTFETNDGGLGTEREALMILK